MSQKVELSNQSALIYKTLCVFVLADDFQRGVLRDLELLWAQSVLIQLMRYQVPMGDFHLLFLGVA